MAFSPIAKGYPFEHYDDFGTQRTYGYARQHLGHDLLSATGTPVIAVESGVVEALGWNQYGGWRIGIRSFDNQRYYYYAHLRQNRPYAANLAVGNTVKAGDVIGYVGHTGYSTKENANNIDVSHLHFGLQLIFDESQKECNNEIWVDVYSLTMLLNRNRSEVYKVEETKEYYRKYNIQISD
jgi:murein DD-endopeptidase MepM/ murein hydrolase activator NlpD